jgi:hypothetical protein
MRLRAHVAGSPAGPREVDGDTATLPDLEAFRQDVMPDATGSHPGGATNGLDHLAAEARYHRQRYDLYRAKIYGGRPTSETRLRELQRLCESAEARFNAAKAARDPGAS